MKKATEGKTRKLKPEEQTLGRSPSAQEYEGRTDHAART